LVSRQNWSDKFQNHHLLFWNILKEFPSKALPFYALHILLCNTGLCLGLVLTDLEWLMQVGKRFLSYFQCCIKAWRTYAATACTVSLHKTTAQLGFSFVKFSNVYYIRPDALFWRSLWRTKQFVNEAKTSVHTPYQISAIWFVASGMSCNATL
jgi:hypothetical protein